MLINSWLALQHEGRHAEQVLQPFFLREVGQDREGPTSLESPDSTHLPDRCIRF